MSNEFKLMIFILLWYCMQTLLRCLILPLEQWKTGVLLRFG